MKRFTLSILLLISGLVFAGPSEVPNPTLTPGSIDSTKTRAILCSVPNPGFSFYEKYPASTQTNALSSYGVTPPACTYDALTYQFDGLVPLSLGGKLENANVWPQLKTSAYYTAAKKTELDETLYRKVCNSQIGLPTAQAALQLNWTAAYRQHVNTLAPTPINGVYQVTQTAVAQTSAAQTAAAQTAAAQTATAQTNTAQTQAAQTATGAP